VSRIDVFDIEKFRDNDKEGAEREENKEKISE
jgi:hypothetical protein